MTDDRVTRWPSPASPGNQRGANPDRGRLPADRPPTGSTPARPAAIPVRRATVNPARPPQASPLDAHTEELPVMTDEEFEAAQAAARRGPQGTSGTGDPEDGSEPGVALPAPDDRRAAAPDGRAPKRRSFLVGFAGALTAATVLIALITIGAQIFSSTHGKPGPGALDIAGQALLAVAAVLLQRKVDRRTGARRGWAVVGVFGVTAVCFGVFWWAWLWLFWPV